MAHQLLDRGQVGAGVEEITRVGPAQVIVAARRDELASLLTTVSG